MLQQNNNNNCLDMAHRELLHECRRTNVSLTSALEFGAIPLIKGLRAWAVNGGYSKARRKSANGSRAQDTCQQPPENRVGQRSWSGQVRSGYGHTLDSTNSAARTPEVRQGGLGALVTVATLKGTEGGGRQTQTRCLFLKAQGQGSYICAVGNRGAGARVTGPRSHAVILEGAKEELPCSSRGQRVNHDGADDGGLFKAKPRAIRKWRKCSKTTGSAEKRTTAHGKEEIANQCSEPERGHRKNAVITDPQPLIVTPGNTITQCQKGTSAGNPSQEDVNELRKDKRTHSPVWMKTVAPEGMDEQTCRSSEKPCAKPDEKVEAEMSIHQSNNCSEIHEGSSCADADAQGDTKVSNHDLASNDHQNIHSFVADVPNLGSPVASEADQTNLKSLEIKSATTNCSHEPSIDHSSIKSHSEVPVSVQKNQESRPDENLHSVETCDLTTQIDGPPDTKSTVVPEGRTPVGVECSTMEKKWRPTPMCSPQHWEELITEHGELEVQQSDKSSSRGFSTPTANITVATIHSQPNPAPTTTAAMATAIPALSDGEVGARGGELLPLVNSELLSDPARVVDGDKVATDEGSLDVGEEEDEFGAFMQAGAEHLWMDGFSGVQPLAEGDDYCEGCTSSTDANEPASWASDWTADQSFQQSESTWIAFGQETVEQKIVPDGQWWPSTEKPNLSLSPLHNVSNVFLEAFPSDTSPCEDPEYIPTLKQLLQEPAENSNRVEHKKQSLLDGLQDLDRMIGVKYKRAESLSCKLLLQALHLERPSNERVPVRLKASARFSPNLPTSNQQLAANAKRRLSYDFNRNIVT